MVIVDNDEAVRTSKMVEHGDARTVTGVSHPMSWHMTSRNVMRSKPQTMFHRLVFQQISDSNIQNKFFDRTDPEVDCEATGQPSNTHNASTVGGLTSISNAYRIFFHTLKLKTLIESQIHKP